MKILFLANRLSHAHVASGHRLIYQRMRGMVRHVHEVGLAAFVAKSDEPHVEELLELLEEVETIPKKKQRMLGKYEFEMYSAIDRILTLTPEDRFTQLHHAPQLPISSIPPGIDFSYFNRPSAKNRTRPSS